MNRKPRIISPIFRTIQAAAMLGAILMFLSSSDTDTMRADDRSQEKTLAAKIDAIFTPLVDEHSPGLAVLVLKDGQKLFERGYGLRDLHSACKNRLTHQFPPGLLLQTIYRHVHHASRP